MLEQNKIYPMGCVEGMKELDDSSIDLVLTDPPYNIGFNKYSTYKDNLPDEEYIELICNFQNMPLVMMQYPEEFMRLIVPALGPPEYTSAWCYNGNIPRRFRLIGYWGGVKPEYSRIKKPHKNPTDKRIKKLLEDGSKGTSLYEWWDDIQLVKNVSKEKTQHPCPVPLNLMKRIIILTTNEGDTVLDPFMGSGTTAVACQELNRNFIGFEINQDYVKIANKRLEQKTLNEVTSRNSSQP